MKIYRWIPFTLLACVALFAGQWTGKTMIGLLDRFSNGKGGLVSSIKSAALENMAASAQEEFPTPTSEQPVPPLPLGYPETPKKSAQTSSKGWQQFNILVIAVDNIKAQAPALKGAWLVVYPNDKSHFMLLPLYPAQGSAPAGSSLAGNFSLDAAGGPGEAFVAELASRDIWWTGYVVMDDASLAQILDYAAGKSYTSGAAMLEDLPDPRQDGLGALMHQARLVRSLCLSSNQLAADELWRIARFYNQISAHVNTDANLDQALADWEDRLKRGGITCEFPSLAAAMLLP